MENEKYKILVVDDEEVITEQLVDIFEDNYDIKSTNSGEDALLELNNNQFDMVISDQRMPGMQGTELLKKVFEKSPHSIRILLTGYTDMESAKTAINEGHINRYEEKPINVDILRKAVKEEFEEYSNVLKVYKRS